MSIKKTKVLSVRSVRRLFTTTGLILSVYILSVLFVPTLSNIYLFGTDDRGLTPQQITFVSLGLYYVAYVLGTFLLYSLLCKASKVRIKEFWRSCSFSFEHYLSTTLVLSASVLLAFALSALLLNPFGFETIFLSPVGIISGNRYLREPLYLFLFVLVTPLVEEFAFRGVLLRVLGRFGNRFALYVVAILYSLSHSNATEMLPAFFMSIILTTLTLEKHSIFPAIVVHTSFNALMIPLFFFDEKYSVYLMVAVVMLMAISGFLWISGRYHRVKLKEAKGTWSVVKLFFTTPSVLFATVLLLIHTFLSFIHVWQ